MTAICLLGTGTMGAPMARRLLAAGHAVTVWNRNVSRAAPLADAGARVVASPAEAAALADIAITMLTDAVAVDAVLFGPDGALSALRPGSCVVQMSTIGPTAVRRLAGRMPAGIELVDAPVGGSASAAKPAVSSCFRRRC
jgi:3-hydroxyisobutyrate dehydrogenase